MATAEKTWRTKKTIQELASLLRDSGEKILNGQSKLSLSTGCLSMLNEGFRAIRDEETGNVTFDVLPSNTHRLPEVVSLQFLYDFIQKTKAFKLTHSNETIQGHVSIAAFRALQSLDLRKIPLHLLRGLQQLRPRLVAIACSRCLRNIQELFETCGGDMSSAMSWPELRASNLSYNNIQHLDESLRLLPVLELLDVSHNNITRTDSHLLYLTELRVVNLGYNVIEVIPSFALSSRLLLHTLILRNNNLSHLDGLQDLIGLRELDLANNCLCCHDDLEPLRALKRLRELVVMGNPLSYEKRHRCLTFSRLHPTALKQIVLDGVAINKKELQSCPKQPSTSGQAFDENSLTAVDNASGTSSIEQSLDYSYDLATSTADESEVGIVSRVVKRRDTTKRKKQKKPRRAEISDIDSQMEEDTTPRAPVYADDGHLHMKEKLEVIRNQLGPSWLQSLEIHQSSTNENSEKPSTGPGDMMSGHMTEATQTSDSMTQISRSPGETADPVTPTQSPPNVFKDTPDGSTVVRETKHDGRTRSSSTGGDNVAEWKWQNTRADSVDYGVESEPFIAALADDATNQFLLTVTDRYVLEKDLDGEVTEVLDLQCLRSLQRLAQGGNEGEGEGGGGVVRLVFDYVRKDRQERKYLIEDATDREKFCELLEPMLEDGIVSDQMKDKYECMKCGATFNDSLAKHTFQTAATSPSRNTMSRIGNPHDVLQCPSCGSALIVQLDDQQGAPGWQRTASTPIGKHTSPIGTSPRGSTTLNLSPRKSLFIKDHECSVTVATDVSTSYQSCQTGLSCSFQSLPNSPAVRGGVLARSYPDCFEVRLNHDGSRMKNGAEMMTDADKPSKVPQRTNATMATAGDATACCHNNDDSIETIPEHRPSEYCHTRNSVDSSEFVSRHRYMRVNTAESDIVVLGNHHSSEISCATEDSDILILANNPSTVSLGGASDIVVNSETDSDISVLCPSTVAAVDPDCDTLTSSPRTSASIDIDGPLSRMLHTRVNLGHTSPYSRSHDPSPSSSLTDRAVNSMVSSMYEKSIFESDGSAYDTTSSDGDAGGHTRMKQKRSSPQRSGAPCHSPVANGDVFQYCYDNYAQVDHRLKLHLVMKLFAADEEFQLLLRCGIVLPKKSEFPALLVVSSARLYVLRISGKQSIDHPEKWLKMVQQLPLSTLRGIQLGLGCQLVKLDFRNVCLIALLRDDARSQNFTTQFTAVLQEWVFHGTRTPPAVMTENTAELADLTQNVLMYKDTDTDTDDVDTTLIMFVMCHQETTLAGESRLVPVDLVVTPSHVYLATDSVGCHLVAANDRSNKKSTPQKAQFVFKARQKLLDLTSIDLYKTAPTKASLHFVDECSQEETVWCVTMETKASLQSLVSSISQPWEQEFGVELQVNMCVDSGS